MGWEIGYDDRWQRDVGYGVPATCDQPGCGAQIDRGLGYVCGGEPYGGDDGCGLFFCAEHLFYAGGKDQRCDRCVNGEPSFEPTPDAEEWVEHKAHDPSWANWRSEQVGGGESQ